MTRIACVTRREDDDLLLRPWLAYHGYLFGFENLHVSGAAPEDLPEFAALGVHLDGGTVADHDVLLSLETSQFLIVDGPDGIGCHSTDILAELERIDLAGQPCRMTRALVSRPGCFDLFDHVAFDKPVSVARAGTPPDLAPGPCNLMCLDLRAGPFDPRADISGAGHPVAVRLRDLARFLRASGQFDDLLAGWEAGRPPDQADDVVEIDLDRVPFRAASYLEANPGLVGVESPFGHFVATGFVEGCRIDTTRTGRQELADRMLAIGAWKRDGVTGFANMANTFLAAGRTAEADRVLGAAIARYGETETLLFEHAITSLHGGQFEDAMARWQRFRALYPDNPLGYSFGAFACRHAGRLDEADALVAAGLARMPDDFFVRDAEAEMAGARHDWARAVEIWESLLAGDTGHRQIIEEKLINARFQLRLPPRESGRSGDAEITDGAVAVGMDEAETRRALAASGFRDVGALRAFFMQFESLGSSCEFGLVQRRFGAEPNGLLRWSSVSTDDLIRALEERFAGLDAPGNLVVLPAGAEYVLGDQKYLTRTHSFTSRDGVTPDDFLARQTKRTTYLKRKLIGDLVDGSKIFVHLADADLTPERLGRLRAACQQYGPCRLLTVTVADHPARASSVEAVGDDHLVGNLSRLGHGAGGWDIDFDSWLSVCVAAVAQWGQEDVPAERVA